MTKTTRQAKIRELQQSLGLVQQAQERRASENIEDVAISTIAGNLTSQANHMKLQLLEGDGRARQPVLRRLDGTEVQYRIVDSKYDRYKRFAMVLDETGTATGEFINPHWEMDTKRKRENLEKKGYRWEMEMRPVWVKMEGSGKGTAGLMTVTPNYFPIGHELSEWFPDERTEDGSWLPLDTTTVSVQY